MLQDFAHNVIFIDKADNPHFNTVFGTGQRRNLPHFFMHTPATEENKSTMERSKNINSLCTYVLNKIDFDIQKSLTEEQFAAIEDAINTCQLREKHGFDLRGKINLFFMKYYFVFLIGRDRRAFVKDIEAERIRKVSLIGNLVYFIFIILSIFFSTAVGLYLIKTLLGIDLFPGKHMGRYLGL